MRLPGQSSFIGWIKADTKERRVKDNSWFKQKVCKYISLYFHTSNTTLSSHFLPLLPSYHLLANLTQFVCVRKAWHGMCTGGRSNQQRVEGGRRQHHVRDRGIQKTVARALKPVFSDWFSIIRLFSDSGVRNFTYYIEDILFSESCLIHCNDNFYALQLFSHVFLSITVVENIFHIPPFLSYLSPKQMSAILMFCKQSNLFL